MSKISIKVYKRKLWIFVIEKWCERWKVMIIKSPDWKKITSSCQPHNHTSTRLTLIMLNILSTYLIKTKSVRKGSKWEFCRDGKLMCAGWHKDSKQHKMFSRKTLNMIMNIKYFVNEFRSYLGFLLLLQLFLLVITLIRGDYPTQASVHVLHRRPNKIWIDFWRMCRRLFIVKT